MRELYLINKHNQSLDLLKNKHRFILKAAEALHGIETDIAESESPYMDGSNVDNVRALPRGIELTFKLIGNIKESIDFFTNVVKSKQVVTLREVEKGKDLVIKGIATIPPYTRMMQSCEIVLSVYCWQPYWEDIDYLVEVISEKIDLLNFPVEGQYFTTTGRPFGTIDTDMTKSFINNGDVSVGMILKLVALGDVINPRISCSTGDQNGWYMQLGNAENPFILKNEDELEICTIKQQKYIKINGKEIYNKEPIINYLDFGGYDWLQLETGCNTFSVSTEKMETNSNVYFNIIYKGRYE